jgi:hypothetical protein
VAAGGTPIPQLPSASVEEEIIASSEEMSGA